MKVFQYSLFGFFASASLALADNAVHSMKEDLSYDENDRVAKHYLVYPDDNPNCPAASFVAPYGFEKRPLAGRAVQETFPGYEVGSGGCSVACVERGTDRTLAHAVMPHKMNLDTAKEDLNDWFEDACRKTEVCLMNYHSKETPLNINWVNPDNGKEQLHLTLPYGERKTRCFMSFIGHKLVARDGITNEIVQEIPVEHVLSIGIGQSPPSGNPEGFDFDKEINDTLIKEWNKMKAIKRTFSPLGFKKARLPDDVYAMMGES